MTRYLTLLAILSLVVVSARAQEDSTSKTVIGPRNPYLYDGAHALLAGNGVEGVRLTMVGLNFAQGRREEKIAHANLCAGFILVDQLQTALQHCDWVIDKDPYHWRTYNNRAIAYLKLERFEESEADIAKGQSLKPESTNLKEVKGMYLDEVEPVTEEITIDDRRDKPPADAADQN
jgi:tetratricopeptide (TPR) repeat protein